MLNKIKKDLSETFFIAGYVLIIFLSQVMASKNPVEEYINMTNIQIVLYAFLIFLSWFFVQFLISLLFFLLKNHKQCKNGKGDKLCGLK